MATQRSMTIKYCLMALILAVVGGCMVGPDYSRPRTSADGPGEYFHAGKHSQDAYPLGDIDNWWERFCDAPTTELVHEALSNNTDIAVAAARVVQAEAAFSGVRGRRLPDVSYNFAYDRSQRSFKFGPSRFSVLSTTFSQDISVAYILDLFGKLKRAERAAWADLLGAEASKQAVVNSLVATVINTRVNIATLQRQIGIARANTESRQRTLEIVERRYGRGLVGPVDVRLARENLAASKAAETGIELLLINTHHALDVLLAHRPGSSPPLPETLSDLPDLQPIPIGLPASLLDRRPDVVAAEHTLEATSERIGVSVAQLFPDLTLTGTGGRSADRWRDIWKDETEIYALGFRLVQPIFKGGQLRADVKAAKARYMEAAANYAGTVLKALKEVEDALVGEELLEVRLGYVRLQFAEARAAEELSRERYQRGVESILAVLESERRRRNAENELNILKGQIWATRVNLFLALGGDWGVPEKVEER